MSSFETELARPSEDPAVRAKATWYVVRTGNADVLQALGLGSPALVAALGLDAPQPACREVGGRLYCRSCGCRTRSDAVCRRSSCGGAR